MPLIRRKYISRCIAVHLLFCFPCIRLFSSGKVYNVLYHRLGGASPAAGPIDKHLCGLCVRVSRVYSI